jgi:large subunit ribosomal protein L22
MVNGYSLKTYDKKTMVRAIGKHLPISLKTSVEVLKYIKGKNVVKAKTLLEEVVAAKRAVPFNVYKKDIPHRKGKGLSVGRFPKKTSENIIHLLNLLQANAKDKGLDEKSLIIIHAAAQNGPNLMHYGRLRRRMRKITHIELAAEEIKAKKKSQEVDKK